MSEAESLYVQAVREVSRREDTISQNRDAIESTFSQMAKEVDERSVRDSFLNNLQQSIIPADGNPKTARVVANTIFRLLLNIPTEWRDPLHANFDEEDNVRLFQRLVVNYSDIVTDYQLRYLQGPNYWKSIESNLVFREVSDGAGLDHHIKIGVDDSIEISTSMNSNLILAAKLISAEASAVETSANPEDIGGTVNDEVLDQIETLTSELRENLFRESEESSEGEGNKGDSG